MTVKSCLFCANCHFVNAEPDYSEETLGSKMELKCTMGYWEFDAFNTTQNEFAKMITKANRCKDYER